MKKYLDTEDEEGLNEVEDKKIPWIKVCEMSDLEFCQEVGCALTELQE